MMAMIGGLHGPFLIISSRANKRHGPQPLTKAVEFDRNTELVKMLCFMTLTTYQAYKSYSERFLCNLIPSKSHDILSCNATVPSRLAGSRAWGGYELWVIYQQFDGTVQ